jgi:eukaryotic-like serine/threonine-protein kinase
MALSPGTKFGPYEIVSFIGAGGMGEVYKARDTRLGRDVALKVLPASFAADAERLRRFEQEAQAVAALNHPNIVGIHDIGQHGACPFLVSELLEGENLRELLARGAPSQRRALEYAEQIAQGLAAAHSKDIAHRDLKPDNIFITRDGRVKILDFGLAKTAAKAVPAGRDGGGLTMTAAGPVTEAGTVVGTAGYMSPEQIRGGTVDCRTDIFSFGAVLYEMLSGKRAFKRDTNADTMAAILTEEPPELAESGRQIPPALDRIVRHCLEKAPEQRFQSARDLAFDLESVSTLSSSTKATAIETKQRRNWWYVAAGAALMAIVAAVILLTASAKRPVTGAQFHQVTYRSGVPGRARFTPDGRNIVYSAAWQGSGSEIYTVPADGTGGHPVGIKNARLLAISKQGELALALAPQNVSNVLAPGTLARTTDLAAAPKPEMENIQEADFAPDGSGLAIVRWLPAEQKCQVESPIGKVLHQNTMISSLRFSPDGRYLAFITYRLFGDDRGTAIILRSTGEKVAESPLYESLQGLAWTPSGDEVWTTSPLETGEMHALSLSGKVRQVLAVPGRLRLEDIAADGRLLVEQGFYRYGMMAGKGQSQHDLSWLDFAFLRAISQDGKTVLFEEEGNQEKNYAVFVRDVDNSPAIQLGEGYAVALSRDKRWALAQKLVAPGDLWLLPVGTGESRRISPPRLTPINIAGFLPDGRHVVYVASEAGHGLRTWLQDLDGGEPRAITEEGVYGARVSPDGKWLLAGRNARPELLVPMEGGAPEAVRGVKPREEILGWNSDGQLYAMSASETELKAHIDKLNPHTGTRTAWGDLSMPPFIGVFPQLPFITPDGSAYAFGYRLELWDIYTVTGAQ